MDEDVPSDASGVLSELEAVEATEMVKTETQRDMEDTEEEVGLYMYLQTHVYILYVSYNSIYSVVYIYMYICVYLDISMHLKAFGQLPGVGLGRLHHLAQVGWLRWGLDAPVADAPRGGGSKTELRALNGLLGGSRGGGQCHLANDLERDPLADPL